MGFEKLNTLCKYLQVEEPKVNTSSNYSKRIQELIDSLGPLLLEKTLKKFPEKDFFLNPCGMDSYIIIPTVKFQKEGVVVKQIEVPNLNKRKKDSQSSEDYSTSEDY